MVFMNSLSLGQRLVRERLRLNFSQEEVARALGTTARSINRWEHDKAVPHPHYRQQLCRVFNVSSEALFGTLPLMENTSTSLWNVPYQRNPFFTGREQLLLHLHTTVHTRKTVAFIPTHALSGLGGIGKTQIAVEYAYRYRESYQCIFWTRAETRETLFADFVSIAHLLQLAGKEEQNQEHLVQIVKEWMNASTQWLLILDNVEDFALISQFLPMDGNGSIILTTRVQSTGMLAQRLDVEQMSLNEGMLFLLRRAKLLEWPPSQEKIPEALQQKATAIAKVLDGLPLALDQAGAYIEETECSLSDYLDFYQQRHLPLLRRRGSLFINHPESVSTTFSLCFEQVERASPASAELLRFCAFVAADAIPEEIITQGASELGPLFKPLSTDPIALGDALALLRNYSLLHRDPEGKTVTLHRLVQVVIREDMNEDTQRQWAEKAVRAVNQSFPDIHKSVTWFRCQRYLPHVLVCIELIEQWKMRHGEAGRLLNQMGVYLLDHGQFSQAQGYLGKAQDIFLQILGPEHPQVAQSFNDLAKLCSLQGNYVQAEGLYTHALAIREQVLEPEHPDIAQSFNDLAELSFYQGNYVQAEGLYRHALAIRERVLEPEHPDIAQSLNGLGVVSFHQGNYVQAEDMYTHALAIREQVLEPEHPDMAEILNNLGLLYLMQQKYAQGEPLLQQALAIYEMTLGRDHSYIAIIQNNRAKLYWKQGKYAQAESLFHQSLTSREKALQRCSEWLSGK